MSAEQHCVVVDRLYTLQEVAEYLRVAKEHARILTATREIRGVKVGREWRVPGRELLAFVDRRLVASQPARRRCKRK